MASFLLAWLIIAFQSWADMLWASFFVFLAVGIIGAMSGVLVLSSDYADYYPWVLTGLTANNFPEKGLPLSQLVFSLCEALILFIMTNLDFSVGAYSTNILLFLKFSSRIPQRYLHIAYLFGLFLARYPVSVKLI